MNIHLTLFIINKIQIRVTMKWFLFSKLVKVKEFANTSGQVFEEIVTTIHCCECKRTQFRAIGQSIIGEGNGTPLQCSCPENPMDGEAWWAAVHGVAEGRT